MRGRDVEGGDEARDAPGWGLAPLLVAAALEGAAIVPFRYFPSEDGPTNVASATIMARYTDGFRTYFHLDWFPKFDMLWQLLLAGMSRVVPVLVAERVLLVALIVALPVAGWWAVRGVRSDAGWVAYLLLPVSIGWFLHAGYYGFCLGVVLFFVVIGWWVRLDRRPSPRRLAGLAALLTLTYLAHVLPFLAAIACITAVTLWRAVIEHDAAARRALGRIALCAAPGLALLAAYVATRDHGSGTSRLSLRELATGLVTMRPVLASFGRVDQLGGVLVAATAGIAFLYSVRPSAFRAVARAGGAWLACAVAILVLYVAVPDRIGDGGNISARLSLFGLLAVVLFLAHAPRNNAARAAVVGASLVAAALITTAHIFGYVGLNRDIAELTSVASHLPSGATVVPLNATQGQGGVPGLTTSLWTRPLIQATGYLVAERRVVDLSHFQARYDYFVTQFRSNVDPFATIGRGTSWLGQSPPDVDLLGYSAQTGGAGRIDFVLVWGPVDALSADVRAQLDERYELVFRTARGHATLFRSREASS